MSAFSQRAYRFEGFTIDVARRVLRNAERDVELRPKSFDVLCCLIERAGQLVAKDDIFRVVWPDVTVTEESLARCVSDIRLALEDREQRIIKTVPRRGYLFAVPVLPLSTEGTASHPARRQLCRLLRL